jgi:hypothetical protein
MAGSCALRTLEGSKEDIMHIKEKVAHGVSGILCIESLLDGWKGGWMTDHV